MVDVPDWAFDNCAKGFIPYLRKDFDFEIVYSELKPDLNRYDFDLLHIFFYADDYYKNFDLKGAKVIKEISSHRWEDTPPIGPKSPREVKEVYLNDADSVITVSKRLYNIFNEVSNNIFFVPNGYDTSKFFRMGNINGGLKLGWAGRISDPIKGYQDIIEPAIRNKFEIKLAPGNVTHTEMNKFYNSIDVLLVGSKNEGEPIPLFESMATGCFPVSTDVGIVPELIQNYNNGIILEQRTVEDLQSALNWCNRNLNYVRNKRKFIADETKKSRNWTICSSYLKYTYNQTLNNGAKL